MKAQYLEKVQTIVSHGGGCPDGIASAMILKDVFPRANVLFLNYNTPELDALKAEPGLIFVDFTPPESRLQEFVDAGTVVLDHHEKQKHLVEAFGERGVYTDRPGWSGAMLAYTEVWQPYAMKGYINPEFFHSMDVTVHEFAKLAGIRDTWQKDHPKWNVACEQAEVLRFFPIDSWMELRGRGVNIDWIGMRQRILLGPVLRKKNAERDERLIKQVFFYVSPKGTTVAILPSTETSDVTEKIDAEFLIGFKYDCFQQGLQLRLSMRSRKGYDVGAFAKSLGGGGHKFAAGASPTITWADTNPYAFIAKLVDEYERKDGGEEET